MSDSETAESDLYSRPSTPGLGEWAFFAVVLVLAIAVRFAGFGDLAIEHFDEGVYASNIYCSHLTPAYQYPLRHLYAPPIWPSILEWTIIFFGPSAVMIPGIVFGIASVALLWWVARSWYGPTGAAIASTLLALSDIHVLFSRTALTDVPMAFLMIAAVFAGWKAMLTKSTPWLVTAGVGVGLAWSTKYNGWLALAVIGSASIAWQFVERGENAVREARPSLRCLVIVAIAMIVWSPVVWGLQDVGGYASVSENHRQYFVGFSGWWTSALRQLQMGNIASVHGTFWTMLGLVGFGLAAIRPLNSGIAFFLGAVLGTRLNVLSYVVPAFGTSARSLSNLSRNVKVKHTRKLGTWMSLAWLFGLTLAIPLYTPYLRLVVPLIPVGCLMWADLGTRNDRVDWSNRKHVAFAIAMLISMVAVRQAGGLATAAREKQAGIESLSERTMASRFADRVLSEIPASLRTGDPPDAAIYVYGEPAVFFHLARQDGEKRFRYIAQPAGNLGILDRSRTDPTLTPFVVVGPHGFDLTPEIAEDPRLELVWEGRFQPGRIVALDRATPEQLNSLGEQNLSLRHALYRVKRINE